MSAVHAMTSHSPHSRKETASMKFILNTRYSKDLKATQGLSPWYLQQCHWWCNQCGAVNRARKYKFAEDRKLSSLLTKKKTSHLHLYDSRVTSTNPPDQFLPLTKTKHLKCALAYKEYLRYLEAFQVFQWHGWIKGKQYCSHRHFIYWYLLDDLSNQARSRILLRVCCIFWTMCSFARIVFQFAIHTLYQWNIRKHLLWIKYFTANFGTYHVLFCLLQENIVSSML